MAQYWLDLTRPEATILAELSLDQSEAGAYTLSVIDDGGDPALQLYCNTGNTWCAVEWNGMDAASDMEVYAVAQHNSISSFRYTGVAARVAAVGRYGYVARRLTSSFGLERWQPTNNRLSLIDYAGTGDGVDAYNRVKVSAVGTTIGMAIWGMAASEPSLETASNSDIASGRAGALARLNVDQYLRIKAFGVGTDGDPAPTGPVGPSARRRSPLLLTPW